MSEIQILLQELASKNLQSKVGFMLAWMNLSKDGKFGFLGHNTFESQLPIAIDFFISTEREWQDRTKENLTRLPFAEFFWLRAENEFIQLKDDFVQRINSIIKGESNEHT